MEPHKADSALTSYIHGQSIRLLLISSYFAEFKQGGDTAETHSGYVIPNLFQSVLHLTDVIFNVLDLLFDLHVSELHGVVHSVDMLDRFSVMLNVIKVAPLIVLRTRRLLSRHGVAEALWQQSPSHVSAETS